MIDRAHAFGAGAHRGRAPHGMSRLAHVKAKWDSDNMFRTNRNIKPS